MNKYMSSISLLVLLLSGPALEGYTFTVKNLTNKRHDIALQLKGLGQKQSDTQTVEPYGTKPSFLAQAKSKVQGWVTNLSNEFSNKFNQLTNELKKANNSNVIQNQLTELQNDIEEKIKKGILKVSARQWVNDLNNLKNDVQKGVGKIDWQKKLTDLQSNMSNTLANLSNAELDTAIFSYSGGQMGFCVNKILVDQKSPPIYGISPKQYDKLQELDVQSLPPVLADLIKEGRYTNMSQSLFGICFSRQFDIVDLGSDNLVVITREKI